MTEHAPTPEERGQRIGETFGELSEQIAALVREELERARDEMTERAREAGKAGGFVAVSLVFGIAAAGAALSLPALLLKRASSPEMAAVATGAIYGGVAFVFARRALERLEAAAPADVQERMDAKKEDVASSLKERVPGSNG